MKKRYAFTLIEIMIAIIIFSIGILAVLRILTWDLSLMDNNDMKLQSTVFWKEWLELLYNVRDSNFEKELPWNCIMRQGIYTIPQENMSYETNINDEICKWYFTPGQIVQLWFNKDYYMVQDITWWSNNFDTLFEKNQLCMFTWNIEWNNNMFWYSYCWEWAWEPTFFARYLSFTWIDVGDGKVLSTDKIMKVEAHVLYKKWHKTWEYVFESFIWNY